jgi:hypothetical protein
MSLKLKTDQIPNLVFKIEAEVTLSGGVMFKKHAAVLWLVIMILAVSLSACTIPQSSVSEPAGSQNGDVITGNPSENTEGSPENTQAAIEASIMEDGRYSTQEEVAAYLHLFKKLPKNFITKAKASDLGWESNKGNLWDVTDQMSIGGDTFGNREGRLPSAGGRKWYECDVNYEGGFRGAQRIVYSNDGLIFYTNDHYETFTQLY